MIGLTNLGTADNSGHTATLRSVQIRQSQTSHVCGMLGDISLGGLTMYFKS